MEKTITKTANTVWHNATVTRERRENINQHKSVVLWFTGLSGSGKSTMAHTIEEVLHRRGCRTYVFDGDNVRHGLCGDLNFSLEDRSENIRRIAEMSGLFIDAGIISLTAFISPIKEDRKKVEQIVGKNNYIEIYCNCDLGICESRDVKGLYKKARAGEVKEFTGISSPYEPPEDPGLELDTGNESLDDCVNKVIQLLEDREIIKKKV